MAITRIGFDLDGVICDWHPLIERHYHSYPFFNVKDLTTFEGRKVFWEKFALLPKKKMRSILKIKEFYSLASPTYNSVEFLRLLDVNKIDICYITKRPKEIKEVTRTWLKDFRFPRSDQLFFVDNETGNKAEVLSKHLCDIYVEDRLEVADEIKDLTQVIIYNQPWNYFIPHSYARIHNVLELIPYVGI